MTAITRAVELAGLTASDIDHVNAHATGTICGDAAEARALHRALGHAVPAVYAPKAALGHSWARRGRSMPLLTVQALRDGIIPATLNLKNLDPEIDLDVVVDQPRLGNYRYADQRFVRLRRAQRRVGVRRVLRAVLTKVNWATSEMPRRKKSAQPVM